MSVLGPGRLLLRVHYRLGVSAAAPAAPLTARASDVRFRVDSGAGPRALLGCLRFPDGRAVDEGAPVFSSCTRSFGDKLPAWPVSLAFHTVAGGATSLPLRSIAQGEKNAQPLIAIQGTCRDSLAQGEKPLPSRAPCASYLSCAREVGRFQSLRGGGWFLRLRTGAVSTTAWAGGVCGVYVLCLGLAA